MHKQQWLIIGGLFLALSLALGWSTSMAGGTGGCVDSDKDGVCDCVDSDKDGVCDEVDNCPEVSNPDQEDSDKDGIGDACEEEPPPPTIKGLCHNIGGPAGLGANCDGADECAALRDPLLVAAFNTAVAMCEGIMGCDPANIYAGIFVPHSAKAINAHVKHGDGPALVILEDTRIHDPQPHISANVDCFGVRVFPQPPEPGN